VWRTVYQKVNSLRATRKLTEHPGTNPTNLQKLMNSRSHILMWVAATNVTESNSDKFAATLHAAGDKNFTSASATLYHTAHPTLCETL
jgi:hypothetical protein